MSYEIYMVPPPYVIDGEAHNSKLVVAEKAGMPRGYVDLAKVEFHAGHRRWFFELERHNPLTIQPRDVSFNPLETALQLFETATDLVIPEFKVLRSQVEGFHVFKNGKLEQCTGWNPTNIEPGREYLIPYSSGMFSVSGGKYIGEATEDGFGRLVRADGSTPAGSKIEFRHLDDDQKHRVVRTNLDLPLQYSNLDRLVDYIPMNEREGINQRRPRMMG